jgi:hypothetical protein
MTYAPYTPISNTFVRLFKSSCRFKSCTLHLPARLPHHFRFLSHLSDFIGWISPTAIAHVYKSRKWCGKALKQTNPFNSSPVGFSR